MGGALFWDEDGKEINKWLIVGQKKDGIWISWYPHKYAQKWYEENYKDGKREGLWTNWYSNGNKEAEVNYRMILN